MKVSYGSSSGNSRLPHAASFRDLVVYQKARLLQKEVFEISLQFPSEEKFALIDQIRRCSRSVGAQIAEAWAKRRYEKHFISKLTDSLGESFETEHWLETARENGYMTEEKTGELLSLGEEVGRMLFSMIDKAGRFCGVSSERVKEEDNGIMEFLAFSGT